MLFFLPLNLFILIFTPYISVIPGNDGSIEFLEAFKFYNAQALSDYVSFHPPTKSILMSILFDIGGYGASRFLGLILGCAAIYALYVIGKKLFNPTVALISSLLLATSGLFISVGLFSINDFVMTVMILIAYAFYVHKRYSWYGFFAVLAILSKETAIFFVFAVMLIELVFKKQFVRQLFYPFIAFLLWVGFVHLTGNHLWNDWNYSSTPDKGSAYTILHNLVTFQFLNKYAYENWLHLFIFNYNWLYWIFAILSLKYIKESPMKKEMAVIAVFFLTFTIMVLSFQTYTINRYTLPLLPFLYLFAAYGAYRVRLKYVFVPLILFVSFISLSHSVDPVSHVLWPRTQILGESVYLKQQFNGNDGITYNMQYLFMMRERSKMIKEGNCNVPAILMYDKRTLKVLEIPHCSH